jgi:hypothetical protein
MRNVPRIVLAALFCAAVLASSMPASTEQGKTQRASLVKRGEYLVHITGCNDCHTPLKFGPTGPEPDMARMLSGHPEKMVLPPPPDVAHSPWFLVTNMTAFSGPWGISYAANLTPDTLTGMGIWTEDMFFKAIRTGRHMGVSRQILPPMPWQGYAHLTDEDLSAVYAYLRSIPPITNTVPDPTPPKQAAAGG